MNLYTCNLFCWEWKDHNRFGGLFPLEDPFLLLWRLDTHPPEKGWEIGKHLTWEWENVRPSHSRPRWVPSSSGCPQTPGFWSSDFQPRCLLPSLLSHHWNLKTKIQSPSYCYFSFAPDAWLWLTRGCGLWLSNSKLAARLSKSDWAARSRGTYGELVLEFCTLCCSMAAANTWQCCPFGGWVSWIVGRKETLFFNWALLGFAPQCPWPGVNCSLCEESCCPEFNFGQIQSFIAISGTEVGEFHCDHQQCDIWIGNSGTGVGNIWIGRTQLVKFAWTLCILKITASNHKVNNFKFIDNSWFCEY